ncbi:MAG: tRNA uridine-5-carboxymethylaminomethyl(34) synthesis enzyme MnmG [Christensenellaceae bacterium]|nr:tRNA uridine-5-carboxymethylaminomethyl(34) synthesis enzyme MnmG [Christensenellaceae bacterium]
MGYNAGTYDVVVVGAGHAGCEAALAAARCGMKTLLLTINLDGVALMACNPSIGGTSKGHLVREIDALGGQMALVADAAYMQIKMLGTSKGAAVQSIRSQQDKKRYQQVMKWTLENTDNLHLVSAEVSRILTQGGRVCGVETHLGAVYQARAVVLCTGVYLKGRVIIGQHAVSSGPSGLAPADKLDLTELGFRLQRFKTGTPARVDARSIDFSKMEPQYGDEKPQYHSFLTKGAPREQVPCYLTYTNEKTHEIIRRNLHLSPLYSGMIQGTGARYCPSIEDKVVKFPERDRHQVFIEPEGYYTNEMYVQGMSSSLPEEVQKEFYRTVPGLENAVFMRTAYAIEYDCIDPTQLRLSLMAKDVPGLFFAGQINGTSGYEEAAAQGIVAGINAVQYVRGEEPIILKRSDAYIGVLIDDLVTKGTSEPYRMMTARAEYRLLLRQDNADARLTEMGRRVGLVTDERYDAYMRKREAVEKEKARLYACSVDIERANKVLAAKGQPTLTAPVKAAALLTRQGISYDDLKDICGADAPDDVALCVETEIRYAGYIEKQQRQVERFAGMEKKKLPAGFDYHQIKGLRLEAAAKLTAMQPETLGQAMRISGVSPADISVLVVFFNSYKGQAG